MMTDDDAPYHAHIYFTEDQRDTAEDLRVRFEAEPNILFVGAMTAGKAGPHPIPQFEVHFLKSSLGGVVETIRGSGLRSLVHPLTDDDLADHTTLGEWIGGRPLELDLTTLDPPGMNQGIARFGKTDF
jgi:aromatic ring-cleaving dioxygenase